jgi:hypothetical protein
MAHNYKSHTVAITTWASLDRNGYTPEFRIIKKPLVVIHSLKLNQAFPTKQEAENFAVDVAKEWIDDSSPATAKT